MNMQSLHREKFNSSQLIVILLVLILVCLYIYKGVTGLEFARADDGWMLLGNHFVTKQEFSWSYIAEVFRDKNGGQYSPINTIYYYFIHRNFGYDALAFHISSIILHLINGLLVYIFSTKIAVLFKRDTPQIFAGIVAFLWLLHPMNVEPVIWISASKVLLFSGFSLISLIYFLNALQKKDIKNYFLTTLFFLLSCLCKEQALVLPAVFVCIPLFHNSKNETRGEKIKWFVFLLINSCIALLFLIFFLKLNAPNSALRTPALAYNWFERINLIIYCLNFYITNFFIPVNLKLFYPFPFKPGGTIPIAIYAYNIVFMLLGVFVILSNLKTIKGSFYLFCTLFFIINVIVVLQIFSMNRESITADRYLYMPSIGLLLLSVGLVLEFLRTQKKVIKHISIGLATCIAFFFMLYSSNLIKGWKRLNINEEVYKKGLQKNKEDNKSKH
ncbi:hypothetical protein CLU96_2309 [Chryseobacterium sp. 52]|uniref:hypothetical protein n=1 Tax=Chryseobacterium sp. 52 TaxID=2035213 RepID=UPI000C17971C|nr:hypothetical protein [Chryseobacterium sp. 52]PIF45307.1 hypothetical protein CLU96_2309 [Chryseobacterium sp. 52]